MAFKSIGSLATDVLETAKRVAAARTSAAQIQSDGLVEPSGNTSPSRLSSGEESGAASFGELGKMAEAETPAKPDRREVETASGAGVATDTGKPHMRPALRLVMGNRDMGSVSRRNGFPHPALPRPMLPMVAGGAIAPSDVRERVHAVSAPS